MEWPGGVYGVEWPGSRVSRIFEGVEWPGGRFSLGAFQPSKVAFLVPGAVRPKKIAFLGPGAFQPSENIIFGPVGRFNHEKTACLAP